MRSWYNRVIADPENLTAVFDAVEFYDRECQEARKEMQDLRGMRLGEVQARLPGIVEYRYQQFTELDSIIDYLQIREEAAVGVQRRHYVEHYNRKLTDRMVDKFAETHPDVIVLRELRNHVAAVRNKFAALSRGHEYMQYQLGNLTKLVIAEMADVVF